MLTSRMGRLLPLIALMLVVLTSGAPAWIAELVQGDCAAQCADESSCPDEGCASCSVICSSCVRAHVVVPPVVAVVIAPSAIAVTWLAPEVGARMPVGPPPEGVFHPPRRES